MSMFTGIQGQLLDVTVVGCSKLKDTEWISRQDPYVFLEYATTKFRTRTCTDGGKNPVFQEKTVIPLIEGLREISVSVWNSNTVTFDDFIGTGKIQLQKVLSQGYDDSSWPLQSKSGRFSGEVKVILHFGNAQKQVPPPAPAASYAPPPAYAPPAGYSPPAGYPQYGATSAPMSYPATYPPAPYPGVAYPPPAPMSAYPPQPYPAPAYPPQPYPYPPQNQYFPPGPYPGSYPPPY